MGMGAEIFEMGGRVAALFYLQCNDYFTTPQEKQQKKEMALTSFDGAVW